MAANSNRLKIQGLWINESVTSFNESTLTEPGQLGCFYEKDGKKYQLVKLDSSAVTAVAGQAVSWIDYDDFVVTNDISDNTGGSGKPAGVLVGTPTAGSYGFIQVRGPYSAVVTDGGDDITEGDAVWVDPTTDGSVDSTAGGTAPAWIPLGVAVAADVDSLDTVAVQITVPLNGE